jgi:parvulin-like peptidyl-prolyl isomerase
VNRFILAFLGVLAVFACENPSPLDMHGHTGLADDQASSTTAGAAAGSAKGSAIDLDSHDILARTETTPSVTVKHVLIAWKDLAAVYGRRMDPRARARTNEDAAKLAKDVADQLRADPDKIDELVQKYSEDPGSKTGDPYTVDDKSQFMPDFEKLAHRLKEKEVGICHTPYGYHVMERVIPPPPDPLESADILARPEGKDKVWVQHILVSWKDAPAVKAGQMPPDAARDARTKEQADQTVKDALAKLKAGGDMTKLMKELSEDPGSKDDGKPYPITPDAQYVPTFKAMGLRLNMGEYGLVRSPFGWHLMKRVEAPPPDPLDSVDILKRGEGADHVKIKHILLGYEKAHSPDPRGAKRTREDLDKLVKDTVAKLKGGTKIETLMTDLSEDGASKTGRAFDVTAKSRMPDGLKDLALRLQPNEVGVVMTESGVYIAQRTE